MRNQLLLTIGISGAVSNSAKNATAQGPQLRNDSLEGIQDGLDVFFYTRDHLGSVRELVDSSGAIRARYDYDVYGRRTKVAGDKEAPHGFAGYYIHSPSGLSLTLYRPYDASLGRWLSQDPLGFGAGLNLYAYVDNDPVNMTDPSGLNPRDKHYGLPKALWRWYHRQVKDQGDPDLSRPEAEELAKEWERQGEPNAEGRRTKPGPEPPPDRPGQRQTNHPRDPEDDNGNDQNSQRQCTGPACPEVVVPVTVGVGVGAYVVWKVLKTCACTGVGGPALGGVCLVTP